MLNTLHSQSICLFPNVFAIILFYLTGVCPGFFFLFLEGGIECYESRSHDQTEKKNMHHWELFRGPGKMWRRAASGPRAVVWGPCFKQWRFEHKQCSNIRADNINNTHGHTLYSLFCIIKMMRYEMVGDHSLYYSIQYSYLKGNYNHIRGSCVLQGIPQCQVRSVSHIAQYIGICARRQIQFDVMSLVTAQKLSWIPAVTSPPLCLHSTASLTPDTSLLNAMINVRFKNIYILNKTLLMMLII